MPKPVPLQSHHSKVIAPKIEYTDPPAPVVPVPQRLPWWRKPWLKITGLTILALGLVGSGYAYHLLAATTGNIVQNDHPQSFLRQIGSLLTMDNRPLQGESTDRINILLLGIGGTGHDGPLLTDTIMVASIQPSTHKVALLSLPRDLLVNYGTKTRPQGSKINNAYTWGGWDLAEKKVTDVTGLTMNYYVVLDFSGFRKIIDDAGGLDVNVADGFSGWYGINDMPKGCAPGKGNKRYITDGYYCKITFTAGQQHMDGERALEYARIRHVIDNPAEANDFGRSHRQQIVITNFKTKMLSLDTLLHPERVTSILNDVGTHLKTNLEPWEMLKLGQMVLHTQSSDIISKVVDETTTKLVKTARVGAASVVIPVIGIYNFTQIQALATTIFELPQTDTTIPTTNSNTNTNAQPATVQVLNGTTTAGLATTTANTLKSLTTISITNIGNAPAPRTVTHTLIYDLTNGKDKSNLALLKKNTKGTLATAQQLATLKANDSNQKILNLNANFIIVLGTNAN